MNGNAVILVLGGAVLGLAIGLMLTPLVAAPGEPHLALWLEVMHRVCTSIGGIGTFVALIFVARQFKLLQSQTELLQKNVIASMESALYSRLDSFNRFIVEHHKIYDLLNSAFEQPDPQQRAKLHHMCDLGFTFYEEIFKYFHRYQLLETEDWNEWNANMRHFLNKPYVRGYWGEVSSRYTRGFQTFVDSLYAKLNEPSASPPSTLDS